MAKSSYFNAVENVDKIKKDLGLKLLKYYIKVIIFKSVKAQPWITLISILRLEIFWISSYFVI